MFQTFRPCYVSPAAPARALLGGLLAALLPGDDLEAVTDDDQDKWEYYNDLRMRREHQRMVITDDRLREIIAEYRELH